MTTVSHGKPYAGNPHVRFEEGDSASAEPRRKALLHNEKVEAAEAARELTLALLFLNRWRNCEGKKNARKYWPWQAWKGFDFDALNEFEEKDFIRGSHKAKSVTLTKTGMAEARRILEKYNIADWESLAGTEDWPAWLDGI